MLLHRLGRPAPSSRNSELDEPLAATLDNQPISPLCVLHLQHGGRWSSRYGSKLSRPLFGVHRSGSSGRQGQAAFFRFFLIQEGPSAIVPSGRTTSFPLTKEPGNFALAEITGPRLPSASTMLIGWPSISCKRLARRGEFGEHGNRGTLPSATRTNLPSLFLVPAWFTPARR